MFRVMGTPDENSLATLILDSCFDIHRKLGPGLLESVYEEILFRELINKGVDVQRQIAIPLIWKNQSLDRGFRADIIVESLVLIEIKSVEFLAPVHSKQVITYLKLTGLKLGLLINFNENLLKDGIKRIAFGL